MHALLGELFPWIVALYVADGIVQARRGHLLLVAAGRRFRLAGAGLHLVGLWPLEELVAAHDLPFLASERRVFVLDPRRRSDPALVAAADLEAVDRERLGAVERDGRKVKGAGRVLVVAPTPGWAERIRADLSGAPDAAARDLAAAVRLRARHAAFLFPMRAATGLLAAVVFGLWPAAAYLPEAGAVPAAWILAAAGGLVLVVAALSAAMLAACGEGARGSLSVALHLVSYPVAALHPLVHATRGLYRRFDAMTAAAALLPPPAFHALAAREIRRARLSRAATPAELAPAWAARERELAALLAATGTSAAAALAAPSRVADAAAWCPLCGAQYRAGFDRCGDCDVAVEAFAAR